MKIKIIEDNYLDIPVGSIVDCSDFESCGIDISSKEVNKFNEGVQDDGFVYYLSYDEVEFIEEKL